MDQTPLAVVSVDGIDRDRFTRIQAAAITQFKVPMSGDAGTISHDGVDVDYSYAGARLTLNIMRVPQFFGHPVISPSGAQLRLLAWVETVQ